MLTRALLLTLLLLVVPAPAVAAPLIGMCEQKPEMFQNPRWQALGLTEARYMTPWDVLRDKKERAKLDT